MAFHSMKYLNIKDLLDNTTNQLSKYRTKDLVEKNDDASGTYNTKIQN